MERRSSLALLISLLLAACSRLGSNGAMIAAANKYEAANSLCINSSWGSTWTGPVENEPPPGYKVLIQASLGHYTRTTSTSLGSFTPSAALKPFFNANNGGEFCVAHVVADSVAASEPLGNEAAMFGMSKDALRVEFRTHIDYGPWNSNSQVQRALNNATDVSNAGVPANKIEDYIPSITLIMYNDPAKGWVVLGRS